MGKFAQALDRNTEYSFSHSPWASAIASLFKSVRRFPTMEEPQVTSSAPPPMTAASGLADNVAGALAYITILPAILFLILPDYNRRPFVRFHAL